MPYFAQIVSGYVTQVIVAEQDVIDSGSFGTSWVQTSENGDIRKNYAGIGYTFDSVRDAFIPPTPYPSWTLDEETCRWSAPIAVPAGNAQYEWDEATLTWSERTR